MVDFNASMTEANYSKNATQTFFNECSTWVFKLKTSIAFCDNIYFDDNTPVAKSELNKGL